MSGAPSPTAMIGDDLPDYRKVSGQAKNVPPGKQLVLLQCVNAALQNMLCEDWVAGGRDQIAGQGGNMKRARLDMELVRRYLAASRIQAAAMIQTGRVLVSRQTTTKPTRQVEPATVIVLRDPGAVTYVSRGAHKLLDALDYLEPYGPGLSSIEDGICLDAGAFIRGFTDTLLRRRAAKVFVVDTGYGQPSWRLCTDSRVASPERTNVHILGAALIDPPADLVVGDPSFASLEPALPALAVATWGTAWHLVMTKPQFEIR